MGNKKRPASTAKSHKLSLSRRSLCVRKKAYELTVLCDASICLMHFDQDGQLKTFPEDASEVNNVLKRYFHVSGRVTKKRKVPRLTFEGDKAKKPDPVLGDMRGEGSPPSLGDELLDAMPLLELHNFRHDLDVRMKKLEGRIKLRKGIKSPEKKQKASTLQSYQDGTPFNPDDLELSCNFSGCEPFSKHDGIDLAASSPDLLHSPQHLGLAANNLAANSFSFSEQPSTNSSSCDSDIQKMNGTSGEAVILEKMMAKGGTCQEHQTHDIGVAEGIDLLLKGDETTHFRTFYKDGIPCSDSIQMNINFCDRRPSSFLDCGGLACYSTNLLFLPFHSIETATTVAQGRFPSTKLPYSNGSSWHDGCEMDGTKEHEEWKIRLPTAASTHVHP